MPDGAGEFHRANDDEITPGELRRWLVRIEATIATLVSRVEMRAMQEDITDLKQANKDAEADRKADRRLLLGVVLGVVAQAVFIALKVQGARP